MTFTGTCKNGFNWFTRVIQVFYFNSISECCRSVGNITTRQYNTRTINQLNLRVQLYWLQRSEKKIIWMTTTPKQYMNMVAQWVQTTANYDKYRGNSGKQPNPGRYECKRCWETKNYVSWSYGMKFISSTKNTFINH